MAWQPNELGQAKHNPHAVHVLLITHKLSAHETEVTETPIFKECWGSSLVMPWPSCKSKDQKKKVITCWK